MNLYFAMTKEKAYISAINGTYIDSYLNYDMLGDFSNAYTFLDKSGNVIATISPSEELRVAPMGPGFFLISTIDGEEVQVELVQTQHYTIRK